MRRALYKIHQYLAAIVGIFVLVFGITGSIMAFGPELDRLLFRRLSFVTPGEKSLSLAELDALVSQRTGEAGWSWAMSPESSASWRAFNPKVGTLYLNPHDGEILGSRQGLSLIEWITQMHVRLALPRQSYAGVAIMNCANVLAMLVLISGIYLWWPLKRVTIKGKISGRRFWFDVHNTIGILSLVFVLALSVTGIFIGYGTDLVAPLFVRAMDSPRVTSHQTQISPPDGKPISPDRAIEIARYTCPGAVADRIFIPPDIPNAAYAVGCRYPGEADDAIRVALRIDRNTGAVRSIEEPPPVSASARIEHMNMAIHTGTLFGTPSKVAMSLASLMIGLEVVTGAVMWWKRRRKRPTVPAPA